MREYALIFFPPKIKAEVLDWVSTLDVEVRVKCLLYEDMNISYHVITFNDGEDELLFRLKYWLWIG